MKVYISGKISGLPKQEAWCKFAIHAGKLKRAGHTVINPVTIDRMLPGLDWKAYMTIAYGILHYPSIDAIYMLKDWTESAGAIIEWSWAQAAEIPTYFQDPAHYVKYGGVTHDL